MERMGNIFVLSVLDSCFEFLTSLVLAVLSCLVLAMEVRESNWGTLGSAGCSRPRQAPATLDSQNTKTQPIHRCPQDVLAVR